MSTIIFHPTFQPTSYLGTNSTHQDQRQELLSREWLLTNGLGGYASGTLSGVPTRRYHGLLIAALPAPLGRQLMLSHLSEIVTFSDTSTAYLSTKLAALEDVDAKKFSITQFRLDEGLPIWRYELKDYVIERRVLMLHHQNTVIVRYDMLEGEGTVDLTLQPSVNFRPHEARPDDLALNQSYSLTQKENRFEIHSSDQQLPPLRLHLEAEEKRFISSSAEATLLYQEEKNRGYSCNGTLWTPGHFEMQLNKGSGVTFFASVEQWEAILALKPEDAFIAERSRRSRLRSLVGEELQTGIAEHLVLAADQFVITPAARVEDAARAYAVGEESRSVIAGYHWFTDWGRDTMISLEGLTLTTGRHKEARWILHSFASSLKNGLIPNLFPEGEREGLYHTADATLWFFHALSRYLEVTDDYELLKIFLPKFLDVIKWHERGTDFGIGVDQNDQLLKQGAEGYQLTWMDAKVDGWVVTPRRGKAVEINALWYNALKLMEDWLHKSGSVGEAERLEKISAEVFNSFNARFWNSATGYLFDVVDCEDGGNDPACRPNQIFSISLTNPVLKRERWRSVMEAVQGKLLTPVGLRSLSADHKDYKSTYTGDLRSRDAAYHQGTVWGWLIGPYIDAWLKVYPGKIQEAGAFLNGFSEHLSQAGVGTISEIFDAEKPFTARGCIAQAWSIAEVLRCYKKTLPS